MFGHHVAFFGVIVTPLVRRGADERLPGGEHTFFAVHLEMLLQICAQYPGLPDVRTLRASEIRTFYNGIRGVLYKLTKAG